jgi:hypothetical protein
MAMDHQRGKQDDGVEARAEESAIGGSGRKQGVGSAVKLSW